MQGEKNTYKAFLLYNLHLWCAINKTFRGLLSIRFGG